MVVNAKVVLYQRRSELSYQRRSVSGTVRAGSADVAFGPFRLEPHVGDVPMDDERVAQSFYQLCTTFNALYTSEPTAGIYSKEIYAL